MDNLRFIFLVCFYRNEKKTWEQRKFDIVFDCTIPNNTLSRAELSYDEGIVLNVHYGDILVKYGSVLDVQRDEIPHIPQSCREDYSGALLQEGDIIIADTAEDETTGKACEIDNLQGSSIVSGLHTMVCRPRKQMASGYLGYYLNSNAYHHQLLPLMQGIKVLSLSRSNIQKTSVSYPAEVEEQQLIASYFKRFDNLVTLHQRKLEKVKELKQAYLSEMFPAEGETIPKRRFKGFTGDWEQRKLGDLYTERNEQGDNSLQILSVSIHTGVSDRELTADGLGKKVLRSEDKSTYKHVYAGDLIFNMMRAWQGAIGVAKNEGMTSPAYISAIPNDEVYSLFMNYLLRRKDAINQINNLSYGVTDFRKRLYWDSFTCVTCLIPCIDEQKRITEVFENLDNLITLHQRKLRKFQIGRIRICLNTF